MNHGHQRSEVNEAFAAAETTRRGSLDPDVLRTEGLHRLLSFTALVRGWAEELDWSMRQIEKRMKESRLGIYEAPALIMPNRVSPLPCDPASRPAASAPLRNGRLGASSASQAACINHKIRILELSKGSPGTCGRRRRRSASSGCWAAAYILARLAMADSSCIHSLRKASARRLIRSTVSSVLPPSRRGVVARGSIAR